jgi:hypothetical protein
MTMSCSAPQGQTRKSSSPLNTHASIKITLAGPLKAPSAGNYYFTFSDLKPGDDVTLATLTVTNGGAAPLTLDVVSLVNNKNLRLVGALAADARRVSPGTYASFPPKGLDRSAESGLLRISDFPPIRPGESALLLVGVSLIDAEPGTLSGIAATYRSQGHAYRASFRNVALLCPGNAETQQPCTSALSRARAEAA